MDSVTLVVGALRFIVSMSVPFILAALCGALIAGILRVVTQIEENVVSFTGKFAAVCFLLFLFGSTYSRKLFEYTESLWSRPDLFF